MLRQFLDGRKDKVLASSAYVEALVKFRNNPDTAERIHTFMKSKNLQIINNVQYQTFSLSQISNNLSLSGEELSDYINNTLLPEKIDIEVRFAVGFFASILLLYTKYKIDDSRKICPTHEKDIEEFIIDKIIDRVENEFRNTLQDAYYNYENKEQKLFKEKYIDLLEDGCKLSDALIKLISDKGLDMNDDDIWNTEKEIDEMYNGLHVNENYVMRNICKVLTSRPTFLKEAKKLLAEIYSDKGMLFKGKEKLAFKPIQIDYIAEEMYSAWIDEEQKYRKNDIFDLFFIGCADYRDKTAVDCIPIDNSTYLLTFDKKVYRYIEKKLPSNGKMIRRFFNEL